MLSAYNYLKKNTWLIVLSIALLEVLSWAMIGTKMWPFALILAFVVFGLCVLLFKETLKAHKAVALKCVICTLCICVIAGHLYGWAWLRSSIVIMLPDARVIEIYDAGSDSSRVKLSVTMLNAEQKEYDVLFPKEDAELLSSAPDKRYDVVVKYYGCWPHYSTEQGIKVHSST